MDAEDVLAFLWSKIKSFVPAIQVGEIDNSTTAFPTARPASAGGGALVPGD